MKKIISTSEIERRDLSRGLSHSLSHSIFFVSIFLMLVLLSLITVPSVMTSSNTVKMSLDAQPYMRNNLSQGYALTLHLLTVLDANSPLVNSTAFDNSLDNVDFSSVYELDVIRSDVSSELNSIENTVAVPEESTGYTSYRYFDKIQFPISYSILEYGQYKFRLSRISDGSLLSEVEFNYTPPYENSTMLVVQSDNNSMITSINNTSENNTPVNIPTAPGVIDILNDSLNVLRNTTLNVLDKCSNVYATLDKSNYSVGDSVQIMFSNIFGKTVNTELTITTQSAKYKFVGDLSDAVFIPSEEGEYVITLTCDNAIIFETNFSVVSALDNTGVSDYEGINSTSSNSTWKKIILTDSEGNSVVTNVRIKNIKNIKSSPESSINGLNTSEELTGVADIALSTISGLNDSNLVLNDLVIPPNQDLNLFIEDVPRENVSFEGNVVASFAMDLSNLNFTNGTFTKTAIGKELWKCAEWDFSLQQCNGSWIKIMNIIPGAEYNLTVSAIDPGYVETGVATVNTLKSLYYPNEDVDIVMVVLDTKGYLVQEANVSLTIIAPDNTTTLVSTNDYITQTHKGIYEVGFTGTSLEGVYTMIVHSSGENVNSTMISQFTVSTNHSFEILRNTPVTIDPKSGPFTTNITVINNLPTLLNVSTFDYTEVLPSSFNVTDLGGGVESIVGNEKHITWYGLTNNSVISYSAQTPLEVPNVYELGPGFISYTYNLGNVTNNNVFQESRPWFLAIDPLFTGTFFMLWDGASSAPAGWTCVSCNIGDPFYEKFIMGNSTYGNVGGSSSHNHTITYVSETAGTPAATGGTAANPNRASGAHTHGGIVAATTSNASNYPLYRQLKVIAYNGRVPKIIPAGAIGIFNSTTLPANWTLYNAENGYFILGNSTANVTGGSNNHTHVANITTSASAGTTASNAVGGQTAVADAAHSHTGYNNTNLSNNIPVYLDVVLAQANSSVGVPFGQNFIGMFNGTIGDGWINLSQSGQPFYNKIIRAAGTYGGTGGSNNNTHSNLVITTGGPNATANTASAGAASFSGSAHTHNITVSFSTADNTPPYVTVVFGYANNSVLYPPIIGTTNCYKQGSGWVSCTTLGFNSNLTAIRTNCTSDNYGGSINNVTYTLTNIDQNITYLNVTTTNSSGGYWIYNLTNSTLLMDDSGYLNLDIVCTENTASSNQDINWTIPWGVLSVKLISPNVSINVTQNRLFNFSVNLSCITGQCGDVRIVLDPANSWWNSNWAYRRVINITNNLATIIKQNYSINISLNTTGANFLANGSDVRIAYWNGTVWKELDRVNETAFNNSNTQIWFKIQSNISASGYDDNYYVYYGNVNAGTPPSNKSNVYLWFDDFNRADKSDITTESSYGKVGDALWNITNNMLVHSGGTANPSKLRILALGSNVSDVDMRMKINVTTWAGGADTYRFGFSQDMDDAGAAGRGYIAVLRNALTQLAIGNDPTAAWGTTAAGNSSVTLNNWYYMRYQSINYTNPMARMKIWSANIVEPAIWNFTGNNYNTNTRTPGYVGLTGANINTVRVYVDDLQIRYILSTEPNATLGAQEIGKQDIPFGYVAGAPFYTTTANPMFPANNSCLSNMISGSSCGIVWTINATGPANSAWSFFTITSALNFSSYINNNISSKINITIIGNVAPIVQSTVITPYEALVTDNLNCTFNITDQNVGDTLSATVRWYRNGIFITSQAVGVTDSVLQTTSLSSAYLTVGDLWSCGVVPYDQNVYGTELSSQNITIYASIPPKISSMDCLKDNAIWVPCSSILYNQTIGKVRANCTSRDDHPVGMTFSLKNIEDNNTFFSGVTYENSTGYWIFDNLDLLVLDSGNFNLSTSCNDSLGTIGYNSSAWFIPWGNLTVKLISPNTSMNVTSKQFFNFTSSVTCTGGECGYIKATLDPYKEYFYSFENDEQGWTHTTLNGTCTAAFTPCAGNDYWHIDNQGSKYGDYCFKFGSVDNSSYGSKPSGILVSPQFAIRTNVSNATNFTFYHYVSAEYASGGAWDGGMIQYSIDNGSWQNITDSGPNRFISGAYNYNYYVNNAFIATGWPRAPQGGASTLRIFGNSIGAINNFTQVVVNLSGLSGEYIQFRFYFGGDDNGAMQGWFIDGFNITAWDFNPNKGIVSMNTSALPFYTTTQNPANSTNMSCLANMHSGDTCNTTWWVNASDTGGVYTFYTIYEAMNYSTQNISKNTSQINLTIISNVAPYVSSIALNPQYAIVNQSITCTFTVRDAAPLDTLGVNFTWYRNNTIFSSTNISVLHGVEYNVTIGGSNLSTGDTWHCGVRPYDQQVFGVQVNSSNKTVVIGFPKLNEIQCLRNDTTWVNCSALVFGDKFSGVRANCTNVSVKVANASFNLSNTPDSKTFFNVTTTTNITDWWYYYYNMTITDSGEFVMQAICTANNTVTDKGNTTWSIPWGRLVGSLVDPINNVTVEANQFFTFTANVSCLGGECGNVTALLDPGFSLGSPTNGTADTGRWINGGGDSSSGSYVNTQTNDTTYYIVGKTGWGDTDSQIELGFNLTSLGVDAQMNITSINLSMSYCHNSKTLANFVAQGCNGANPITRGWSGNQNVYLYNTNTSTWDVIGILNVTDGGNLVYNLYSINGSLTKYVNSTNYITARFDMKTGNPNDVNPAWLGINWVMLTLTYGYIKGGAPVKTTIGARPFYTINSNPFTVANYSCLSNMSSLNAGCQFTWNVNATGVVNLTGEFWVVYNSSQYSSYINPNSSSHIWITIGNASAVPPIVALNTPANNIYTSNSSIKFNCSATDNRNVTSIALYNTITGSFAEDEVVNIGNKNGSISLNRTLSDGIYTWNCLATDSDSNTAFAIANRTLTVDTTPPYISLSTPLVNDSIASRTVTFNFSVIDNLDSSMFCNLTLDSIIRGSEFTANNNSLISKTVINLTQGDHYWNVTCRDHGNNYNTSETRKVTVLSTPPTLALQTIDNYFTNSSTVYLYYFVDDGGYITQADLYINGVLNQTDYGVITGATNLFTITGSAQGKYNWTVNVTNNGGLTSQATPRIFYVEFTAPALNVTFPPDGYFNNLSTITFNFTVIDPVDTIMSCKIRINNVDVVTGINANNNTPTLQTVNNLKNGINLWNITCQNDAGNSNTSLTRTMNVSAPPVIVLNNPANNTFQKSENITLYYTPTASTTNLSTCTLILNGIINQTNTTPVSGSQNNFKLINMSDGLYTWSVNCTDNASVVGSSAARTFGIDRGAPNITLNLPAANSTMYGANTLFNWTAYDAVDPSLTCSLIIDGLINKSGVVSPNGQWVNVTVAVAEGNHSWSVNCTDHALNLNNSETRNFTQIGAPTVTPVYPAQNAYLNYTNNINLTYIPSSGNTLVNATLYINGIYNQTVNNPSNGVQNSFFFNFTNGVYNWTVIIFDNMGLNGSSPIRTFSVDTVSPSIGIITPTNGQTISANNVTFKFNVTDNLLAATTCNITLNGTLEWSNVSVTNGSTITKTKVMNDGNYNWRITCVDNAGNKNVSNLINFTVYAPPNVTLNSPGINYRTALPDIVFKYTPQDDVGLDTCILLINGVFNQSSSSITKNVPNYFNINGMASGDYNWTVRCNDTDSNIYAPLATNFTIDTTPPTITMTYPGNGDVVNIDNIPFNWTATDYPVNIACMLYIDGTYNRTVTQMSGTYFTPTVGPFTPGSHNWSLNCSDDLNNSISSSTLNFTVNNADLYLDNSRITFNNTNPNENQTITISANVSNIGGVIAINALVNFYDGDPNSGGIFIGNATRNVTANSSTIFSTLWNITTGYHTIYVSSDPYNLISELNELNNNATKTISLLQSTITSPINASNFTNPNISVTFNLKDYTGGSINYSVYVDNVLNGQNGTVTDTISSTIGVNVTQGTHAIKIEALDTLGRRKNSTAVSVTVDYTAPTPTITTGNNSWYNYTTPQISISATDNVDTNINYTIYVNGGVNIIGNISSGATIPVNLSTLTEGYYQLIMEAFDDFGNIANSTPKYIYVDLTPPNISLNSPADGANYTTRTVVLNYTPYDNMASTATCNITLDGVVVAPGTYNINQSTTYTANNLAEGTHYWNVTCGDQALNRNISQTKSFNVFIAPVITLLTPPNNNWSNSATNNFFFNASDETGLKNCSILINGLINQTKTTAQLSLNSTSNFTINSMVSGNYTWSVECYDNTTYNTYNISSNRTFYVDLLPPQPTITTLNNSWFSTGSPLISFNITDNMDNLLDYTFYANSTPNVVGTVSNNSPTSINLLNLLNGTYVVTLEGVDNAGNRQNSTPITIYIDTIKPYISLTNPSNGTNISLNNIDLNFTPYDNMASTLNCSLTLDGNMIATNMTINNGQNKNVTVSGLAGGYHYWNVTCIDQASNSNISLTNIFYVVMPDLYVNVSSITFSNNNPVENETLFINATVWNVGLATAPNFTVEVRVNTLTGTMIYNNTFSLNINESANITANYSVPIGDTVFIVIVDPPLATNGSIKESNESNNNASRTIHVGLWEYVAGATNDKLTMTDSSNQTIFDWLVSNASGSKLFAADVDSNINWKNLQALGLNITNVSSPTDFSTLDTKLGSTNFSDSVNRTYTSGNSPIETINYTIYTKKINSIPIVNSTNNSNFKTGILWDYGDGGVKYTGTQDVLFVSPINKNTQGYNATVDYELRIPATLRSYKAGQDMVVFYAEIN